MKIDINIQPISVEIDGVEYKVAPKTLRTATRLAEITLNNQHQEGKAQYQTWLEHLTVILGAPAVTELFSDSDEEDLDRMEIIYLGVMDAFDYNGQQTRNAKEASELAHLKELSEVLTTIADKVAEIYGKYPGLVSKE